MKKNHFVIAMFVTILSSNIVFAQNTSGNSQEQYEKIENAISRLEELKSKNDWRAISLPATTPVDESSEPMKEIEKRLELLGDFKSGNLFAGNRRMGDAVRKFQARHGLEQTGIVDATFLKALNVPLDTRINQLRVNKERLLKENTETQGKRIVANIPEYKLHAFENGHEVLSMDIVVGKTTNKTMVFSDALTQIVFSPYWNIPESIVKNEILPAVKRNGRYLRMNQMEIVGTRNGVPEIRQKPGPKNSLGKVKFLFPNKYDIYFHDTPAKALFARNKRAFSHGCIRLSQPLELAKYLLKDDPKWNEISIRNAMNGSSERAVTLKTPVPVSISYYTAWVDGSGNINFREDIYGHDKGLVSLSK
ncbi:MAG TPA: L,D-transpeptidase family protein [Pedobacter sp.]|jgi:murein L,D-transpeptidase YcbB/YkuD